MVVCAWFNFYVCRTMCFWRLHDDHDIVYSQSVPSSLLEDIKKEDRQRHTNKSTTQKCATRAPSHYVFVPVFTGLPHIAVRKQLNSVVVHACLSVYDRTSMNLNCTSAFVWHCTRDISMMTKRRSHTVSNNVSFNMFAFESFPCWWFEPLWKILVHWYDYSKYMGK